MSLKTFFLAWQSSGPSKAWFPIGRLDADLSKNLYKFAYTKGANLAHKEAGLEPLDAFPSFHKIYQARELFPLFRTRVVDSNREDYPEYLDLFDLHPGKISQLDVLAIAGGERRTDNLEVFPQIQPHENGLFSYRFFVHGWRHVNASAQEKLLTLVKGDVLRVSIELNNPATTIAIQLETEDYHMIGWTPRYLIKDLVKAIDESPTKIHAHVIKVNPSPAPAKFRVLVELKGHWPRNYKPMSSREFQLLESY